MMKRTRMMIAGGVVIALIAGGYFFFFRGNNQAQQQGGMGMPVVTYTIVPMLLKENVQAVGSLEANEAAMLRPEVPGVITGIHFTEGQKVEKGDALLEIDEATYQAELRRAEAAYDLAKLTHERKQELRKTGAVSTQSRDESEAGVRETKATYEMAKIRAEKAIISAPFAGIIGLRDVSVGDYLEVGKEITQVVAIDPMKLEFAVPEKYFASLSVGQQVEVAVDAYPDTVFTGKLYAVDPVIDPDTRNVRAKAHIDNPDAKLRPGMFAYVTLRIAENDKAVMVPEEALIPQGKEMMVYAVVDGKAARTPVTIGSRQGAMVEITSGLKEGQVVVTAGHMKIQDGAPVTPMPAEAPKGEPSQGTK